MPKLDLEKIPQTNATGYPPIYADVVRDRWYRRLAPVAGFTDFGASHVTLKPGAWSAQRHWHEGEDEMVIMIRGDAVLIDDHGHHPLGPGDIATFAKNDGNAHVIINESDNDCTYVAIGRPSDTPCHYPDIDLHLFPDKGFRHKDGSGF